MDSKESEFIKRLKKTKSIMIAQKYRKQKHILNSYFLDNKRKKSNESPTAKSNASNNAQLSRR